MKYENFEATVNPKIINIINLHKALSDILLDFFVTTSSISAILNNSK